ncbi:hatching enzyme 1.2-like [Leptodactylus fuscus]|uniref:hatching enzyme 1.2-like n=1 Tax=Leptodactylus fuscus TaxID=238119 RepID=UPI003F4EFBD3
MVSSFEAIDFAQFHSQPLLLGLGSKEETSLQINLLELRAIFLALSHWTSLLQGYPVQIEPDNSTAISYLNHQALFVLPEGSYKGLPAFKASISRWIQSAIKEAYWFKEELYVSLRFCMLVLGMMVSSFEAIHFAQFHSQPPLQALVQLRPPDSSASSDVDVFLREGDVAFDPFRSARKCKTCTWKKNSKGIVEVPFTIDPDQYSASDISLINESLKEFEVMTCVQFVNWTTQPDYLYIQSGSGCWSYIGRTGGKQTISLSSPSCVVYGVIQHEVMHSIGFFHEHTRVDRDDYINILWQNIAKGFAGNFNIDDGNTMNLPYDYESVMHYSANVYSIKPSLATMVPKTDPIVPIGQRSGLSSLDVRKMNAFYKCNVCREKLVKASGSFSGSSSSANQFGGNCLWLIQVPRNKIEVRFDFLNISSTDYVKVYDGMTKSSPVLLSETYGYGSITPLRSSGRNMLVEFVSVATSTFSTFNATYDAGPQQSWSQGVRPALFLEDEAKNHQRGGCR